MSGNPNVSPFTGIDGQDSPGYHAVVAGIDNTGKVQALKVDSDGALAITGAGSGGTSMTDDAAFTPGTSAITPAGGTYRSVRDSVDDNDGGAFAMTQKRALLTAIETPNGDSAMDDTNDALRVNVVAGSTAGTEYTEDAAAAANPVGTAQILIRSDTPAAQVSTDGDNVAQRGTNYGAAYVQVVNSSGAYVDTFGGGTQYTEGDTDATITGTAMMMEGAGNTLVAAQGTAADGLLVNLGSNNDVNVLSSSLPTGASTSAKQDTIIGHVDGIETLLTAVDGHIDGLETSNAAIQTSVELIDDTVATLGTTTYTEATTKGLTIGAVRRDADTTLVNTTNEIGPLQMDANGRLKVEAFSGEALPVTFTGSTDVATQTTLASLLTSSQLIDDIVYTDDTSTHSTGSSKGALMMAAATPTDTAVNANDIGALAMTVNRELLVQVNTALPAGTNGIGKLTANSGVDIGDVDVTTVGTITPGTAATSLGKAEDAAHSSGDTGVFILGVSNEANTTRNADGDYSIIATDTEGNVRTVGNRDHDAVDAGEVVKVGGRATSAEPTAVASGDRSHFITDLVGKQITLPYANPENFVSGAITTAMTATTSTSLVAAPGAGLRNYITAIIVSNAHATVGTDIAIQDGSGGTTLLTIPAAALYGGAVITLPTPLRQPTTNTALYCANVTTGASTKVSAVGYKGA
ncbi:hypothetical protein [Caudoviricetes sp.]|nr:hypothetical protein [Caudoviricetes sp.]